MFVVLIKIIVVVTVIWAAHKISDKGKTLTSTEKAECLTSSGCLCGNCNKRIEPTI